MANLTTLVRVRRTLGLLGEQNAELDAVIADLIVAVSADLEGECDRTFGQTTYTDETRYDVDGLSILPNHLPLVSVSALSQAGQAIPAAATSDDAGYYLDGNVIRLRGYSVILSQQVKYTYVGGYGTVPADVEQAAVEMVALKYGERKSVGTSSQSISGYSVTYLPSLKPASVLSVIGRWRRRSA